MAFPERLFDLVYIPTLDEKLDELALLAEAENWNYNQTDESSSKPILFNYLQYTYQRLREENKIELSDDGQLLTFNTGLVTLNQEEIYSYCTVNRNQNAKQNWYFNSWERKGSASLNGFSRLPEMAHYFNDPSSLVFDFRKEVRTNIEHIISDNKSRFPEPYKNLSDYELQVYLKGAISNAIERVRRNYKTAIPHYYKGRVQLMLPLCLGKPNEASLAIVVEDMGAYYRAATCLTLSMAYNNARLLARPDRDWLKP
ncbi:DUF3825 domain-containing protein [Aeromonas caviae]|uniref:DUF3825 domain-containing protein n=1 Tax=Aeromonas TaxID=642 RepID=UPI00106F3BA9|nr:MULTISPECIES: DUF3825 domain-containing protein [Aeromonas]TFF76606.1 DUF3825 domain-containing protein [Aeromonas taiwanensis]